MEWPVENVNIFNTIITDIQAVQSRYDGMVAGLNARLKKSQIEVGDLLTKTEELTSELSNVRTENERLKQELATDKLLSQHLADTNARMTTALEEKTQLIIKLESCIKDLEQEKKDFTRVSHVVAIEKENAKLRAEINALKKKMKDDVPSPEPNHTPTTDTHESPLGTENPVDQPTEPEVTAEESTSEHLEVYEKKIKGKMYFVSSQDDKTVYERKTDGSVGDIVGYLEKHGTKTKITWV